MYMNQDIVCALVSHCLRNQGYILCKLREESEF